MHNGALRVAVAAAPDGGKANAAILDLLAESLACRRSDLILQTGLASRRKRVLVLGLDPAAVLERLLLSLPPNA